MTEAPKERWASGDLYEPYVGRWSRLVAEGLLAWLAWELGIDMSDAIRGTSAFEEEEKEDPWYPLQVFAALSAQLAPDTVAQSMMVRCLPGSRAIHSSCWWRVG